MDSFTTLYNKVFKALRKFAENSFETEMPTTDDRWLNKNLGEQRAFESVFKHELLDLMNDSKLLHSLGVTARSVQDTVAVLMLGVVCRLWVKCGIAECGMRKVKCGIENAE